MKTKLIKSTLLISFLVLGILIIFIYIYYYLSKNDLTRYNIKILTLDEKNITEFNATSKYIKIMFKNYTYVFDCYITSFYSKEKFEEYKRNIEIYAINLNSTKRVIDSLIMYNFSFSEWNTAIAIDNIKNKLYYCSTLNKNMDDLIFLTIRLVNHGKI
ncbi:MAG: hypothetical protein QW197_03790 [Candidatus Aenigmatarchaeota archaeon]